MMINKHTKSTDGFFSYSLVSVNSFFVNSYNKCLYIYINRFDALSEVLYPIIFIYDSVYMKNIYFYHFIRVYIEYLIRKFYVLITTSKF